MVAPAGFFGFSWCTTCGATFDAARVYLESLADHQCRAYYRDRIVWFDDVVEGRRGVYLPWKKVPCQYKSGYQWFWKHISDLKPVRGELSSGEWSVHGHGEISDVRREVPLVWRTQVPRMKNLVPLTSSLSDAEDTLLSGIATKFQATVVANANLTSELREARHRCEQAEGRVVYLEGLLQNFHRQYAGPPVHTAGTQYW